MKQILLISIALLLLSCGNSSLSSDDTSTGGTCIEVASITGKVVNQNNEAIPNAEVTVFPLMNKSGIQMQGAETEFEEVSRDSTETDNDGGFHQSIDYAGAVGVAVKDGQGNGAFRPCTLSINAPVTDLGTIVVEQFGSLTIRVAKEGVGLVSNTPIWIKELGEYRGTDDAGEVVLDSLPAGTYSLSISGFGYNPDGSINAGGSDFEDLDTTAVVLPGQAAEISVELKRFDFEKILDTMSNELRRDLKIVREILEMNYEEVDTSGVLSNVRIKRGRVSRLYFGDNELFWLPNSIEGLDQLEELQIWSSGITELPESLGRLKKLHTLQIMNAPYLEDLPSSLANLTNPRTLFIWGNGFTQLPEVLYELTHVPGLFTSVNWYPSEREEEWILNENFRGDTTEFNDWLYRLYNPVNYDSLGIVVEVVKLPMPPHPDSTDIKAFKKWYQELNE